MLTAYRAACDEPKMLLQDELDAVKAEDLAKTPPNVTLVRQRAVEALVTSGLAERAAQAGEQAPAFRFYYDNANAQQAPDEPYPSWKTKLPTAPEFPDDTEAWRALDNSLVAKCLNFPNRVHASQNSIAVCVEYSPAPRL
jgi:hypothetical protein